MTDAETKRLVDAVYGKDKEAKVLKNLKIGQANAKREFLKKYPYADISKFSFQVMLTDEGDIDRYETYFKLTENDSFDITSDTFLNNKKWIKYLTSNKKKSEAEVKAKAKDKGFGIWFANGTIQTYDINHETTTNMDINKIKIYVTDDKWFLSDLSPYTITNTLSADYKKNPFLASLLAAYVTTYVCGISTKHFEYNDHTPGIITSMARYHLYYHMSRFLRDPSELERYMKYIIPFVRRHTPYVKIWEDSFYKTDMTLNEWYEWAKNRDPKVRNYSYDKKRGGFKYQSLCGTRNGHANDYRRFIAHETWGLTKIGQKLFQRSVQSYVYAVLGAPAKTRWPIVGEGAKSLQTQDVFYTIAKETIAESNVTIMISNMRTAIASTNVVVNMAISPGMILVPSNLIIQKEKIPGYNNVLTLATDKMKFGKNTDVNYKSPEKSDPTPIQRTKASTKTNRVIPLDNNPTPTPTFVPKPKAPKASVASEILGEPMMVGGFIISKYIF